MFYFYFIFHLFARSFYSFPSLFFRLLILFKFSFSSFFCTSVCIFIFVHAAKYYYIFKTFKAVLINTELAYTIVECFWAYVLWCKRAFCAMVLLIKCTHNIIKIYWIHSFMHTLLYAFCCTFNQTKKNVRMKLCLIKREPQQSQHQRLPITI